MRDDKVCSPHDNHDDRREAGLPDGKTFATFDFAAVPTLGKAIASAMHKCRRGYRFRFES